MIGFRETLIDTIEEVQSSDITFGIDHEGMVDAILASPEMLAIKQALLYASLMFSSNNDVTTQGQQLLHLHAALADLPAYVTDWINGV